MIRVIQHILVLSLLLNTNWVKGQPKDDNIMLKYRDLVSPFKINTILGLPGDTVELEVLFNKGEPYKLAKANPEVLHQDNKWLFIMPADPGVYQTQLVNQEVQDTVTINYISLIPAEMSESGKLQGYRIGNYPPSQKEAYQPPRGFVKVTEENKNLYISPRFQLKQFVCKQSADYPKMVVLQELLLLKLELIIDYLRQKDLNVRRLTVLSGYRTPYYNKSIGNVKFSRHQYGDASDIFVDNNNDHIIDDLNNDKQHDVKDARIMYHAINDMMEEQYYSPFAGGMGIYQANSRRTAFVHVDVRGYRARWGL